MTGTRLPKLSDRTSGVLLHPTSLPGEPLGASARELVDFLAAAGQSWWQTLPIGPTGYGNSPYQSHSSYAGNPLLISPERLVEEVLEAFAERYRLEIETVSAAEESVSFPLPRAFRAREAAD